MNNFLRSNPGLQSRFTRFITFDDYTPEEMLAIFELFAERDQFLIDEAAANALKNLFQLAYSQRDERFGNGRFT